MQKNPANRPSGFTLIELSISLVIIGLIVGGILGAQDLIRQAEIRGVINDIEGYKSASNAFLLKYNGLPGDLRNAQSYWPSCTDSGANLCNGDGDGLIEFSDPVGGTVREDLRTWEHLSLAGMIPGSYSGGTKPPPPIDGLSYVYTAGSELGRVGNYIRLVGPSPSGYGPSLSPEEAKSIDDKMDDGTYNGGNIYTRDAVAMDMSNLDCVDGNGFILSSTDLLCVIFFWFD